VARTALDATTLERQPRQSGQGRANSPRMILPASRAWRPVAAFRMVSPSGIGPVRAGVFFARALHRAAKHVAATTADEGALASELEARTREGVGERAPGGGTAVDGGEQKARRCPTSTRRDNAAASLASAPLRAGSAAGKNVESDSPFRGSHPTSAPSTRTTVAPADRIGREGSVVEAFTRFRPGQDRAVRVGRIRRCQDHRRPWGVGLPHRSQPNRPLQGARTASPPGRRRSIRGGCAPTPPSPSRPRTRRRSRR